LGWLTRALLSGKAIYGAAPGEVARHDNPTAALRRRERLVSWLDCLLTLRLNRGLRMDF
jgi:hypothetical protein